jgi:hypothetical protein
MLTPRVLFLEFGGFDEANFNVAYNDVDYCYRLGERGYRSIVCPDAVLIHEEGKSRGFDDNPDEIATFRQRYGQRAEPYYNPNLSLDDECFEIRPYRHPRSDRAIRAIAVTHNLNREGAPYAQLEMIVGLHRRGLIDPIVLSPQEGPLRADYELAGIAVTIVTPPDIGAKQQFERSIVEIGRTFSDFAPDVVYANTSSNSSDQSSKLAGRSAISRRTSSTPIRCKPSGPSRPRKRSDCRAYGTYTRASRGKATSNS